MMKIVGSQPVSIQDQKLLSDHIKVAISLKSHMNLAHALTIQRLQSSQAELPSHPSDMAHPAIPESGMAI
jgi:hypothetical protein